MSSPSRSSSDKKVKFKAEHTVHLIKKDSEIGIKELGKVHFTEPILQDDRNSDKKVPRIKRKVSFGFSKDKSYGYFVNPLYKKSYETEKNKKNACDKDVCNQWRTNTHTDCYNLNQFREKGLPTSGSEPEPGFISSSVGFVTGLCGGRRRETDMRGFNLMAFIISGE
ncbi:uncharacterized protein LOC134819928 [Bolinopsis microptera]|uniref:uncharacterized protein LOC134819928 n=1 Tax=Bolinopsis microptera TaxID=2820187 RepID=UPI0030791DD6